MEMFWNPLTLSEAQGFVTAYTVSYRQLSTNSSQQVEMQVAATRNSGTVVTGLQGEVTYYAQVWASTAAGAGERSPVFIVEPPVVTMPSQSGPVDPGAIIGGVVAGLLIVAVVITVIVVAITITRVKGQQRMKTKEE